MSKQRIKQLESALQTLVNLYVCNKDTESEFISCRTPKSARAMTPRERQQCQTWSAWDSAINILENKGEV